MAKTKIEWADYTFNPWIGCTKVSDGCLNCYAERDFDKRRHYASWGQMGTRVKTSEANWKKPLTWNRKAEKEGVRYRVFCASLADVFENWQRTIHSHNGATLAMCYKCKTIRPFGGGSLPLNCDECDTGNCRPAYLSDIRRGLFDLIDKTPYLDWLLVTKRPENIRSMWTCRSLHGPLCRDCADDGPICPHDGQYCDLNRRINVWLLTSVENQEQADKRIPELLKCRDLVPVLGLSCEPLLGPIDLSVTCINPPQEVYGPDGPYNYPGDAGIDWVIAGGESGPNARPMHPDWVRSLRDQCQVVGVPFFFKQWGEWANGGIGFPHSSQAGRILDGVEWSELPEVHRA